MLFFFSGIEIYFMRHSFKSAVRSVVGAEVCSQYPIYKVSRRYKVLVIGR